MWARVDLVTIRLFIAVVEERSLARTAESVHLAASAISKRLADLEHNLNVRLFDRQPTGMFPTAAGTAFLHHARLIMRNVAELESEMVEFAGGMRGTIRVRANATAMTSYLPGDLKSFLADHPNVRIEIEESTTPFTLRAIAENAADIGIYGDVVVPADLDALTYRDDQLALLIPADHPLSGRKAVDLADFAGYAFIGPPHGSSIDTALTRATSDKGLALTIAIRSAGFDAISRLVEARLGIAVVPESVARIYERSLAVEVLSITESWASRHLMICVRDRKVLTPPAAALFAHLIRAKARG